MRIKKKKKQWSLRHSQLALVHASIIHTITYIQIQYYDVVDTYKNLSQQSQSPGEQAILVPIVHHSWYHVSI